jgi:hypothetical protein
MIVNDNAGNLTPRRDLRFIASMLAPTDGASPARYSSAAAGPKNS